MLTLIYLLLLALAVASWARLSWRRLRLGLIAAVVATSVTLGAFPWDLVPVDRAATLTQFAVLLAAILYALARSRASGGVKLGFVMRPFTLGLLAVGVLMAAATAFSPAPGYGVTKTALFWALSVVPYLVLGLLGPWGEREVRVAVVTLLVTSALMGLRMIDAYDQSGERVAFANLYSIAAGRIAGIGVTAALVYLLYMPVRSVRRLLAIVAVLALGAVGLGLSGSRGPVAASLTAVLALGSVLTLRGRVWLRVALRTCLAVALVASYALAIGIPLTPSQVAPGVARIVQRSMTLGANLSDMGRLERYRVAVDAFVASDFLGVGTGGFAALYAAERGSEETHDYPHNFLLEAAAELGVVGLALVVGLVVSGVAAALWVARRQPGKHAVLLSAMPIYGAANALFSYDLAGNYQMWIFLGLLVLVRAGLGRELRWAERADRGLAAALGS